MTQVIQLNPPIPIQTEKGEGVAWFMIYEGMEYNLFWVVAQNDTGEIWVWDNTKVRADKNITLGRTPNVKTADITDFLCGFAHEPDEDIVK